MIRFTTDITWDARGIFYRQLNREKKAMRAFAISLSLAVAAWVSSAMMLAYYSREVAEFIVGRMQ
jgi:hypothetical protein